jgi:hypothetical protein
MIMGTCMEGCKYGRMSIVKVIAQSKEHPEKNHTLKGCYRRAY